MACVLTGRLNSFNAAYSSHDSEDALLGMFGTQVIDRVSPPRAYGARVRAEIKWPIVGQTWLNSERFFALSRPLAIPDLPLRIRPRRYLPQTKQLDGGDVMLRVDLGEASKPRYLEQRAKCDQLALGTFHSSNSGQTDSETTEWAVFASGQKPTPVALHMKAGGENNIVVGLYVARIVAERDGWLNVAGEHGPVAFSAWVKEEAVLKRHKGPMGGLGIRGGLIGREVKSESKWQVTERALALRVKADSAAPVIATLASQVRVRVLERERDFVRISIGPVRRSDSPRVDHPSNVGFFVLASEFAAR